VGAVSVSLDYSRTREVMLPIVSSGWGGLFRPSFAFAVNKTIFHFTSDMNGFRVAEEEFQEKEIFIIIVISGRGLG